MNNIFTSPDEVPHVCHFCNYRHGGCSSEEVLGVYDAKDCKDFEIGKCYSCAIYQCGDQEIENNLCDDVFYPEGCHNFKLGRLLKFDKDIESEAKGEIKKHNHRDKREDRRRRTAKYKRRLVFIAKNAANYPGPYYSKKKNRVVNDGRGQISSYLKKLSNKKVRRTKGLFSGSTYRKVYDYWHNLI